MGDNNVVGQLFRRSVAALHPVNVEEMNGIYGGNERFNRLENRFNETFRNYAENYGRSTIPLIRRVQNEMDSLLGFASQGFENGFYVDVTRLARLQSLNS